MSLTIGLRQIRDERMECLVDDRLLFAYVYQPDTAGHESPKPYFHPLRTLASDETTQQRPRDHPWHTGLAMTSAQLSGQNFWGGPTYVRGQGYVQLDNNGGMCHRSWEDVDCRDDTASLHERLDWVTFGGERWIAEERRIRAGELNEAAGTWALDLGFRLRNVRGQQLVFGSPSTEGRPAAGYGGLFWRGPPSFVQGTILAAGGLEGPGVMGCAAPWLAYSGRHGGTGSASTLIFLDRTTNPRYPTKWFVRNDPYAGVSCSFMFDQAYVLAPDEQVVLDYRVVLVDGAWRRDQIERYIVACGAR